jgi:hypothetical protein
LFQSAEYAAARGVGDGVECVVEGRGLGHGG